eukprot:GILI01012314.1.p1 GENE.GILI01012314.1~~GILI01012314.1.p1  ORF type:complete len:848 (+),score=126.15 GILI01012314.1:245-2545(+)
MEHEAVDPPAQVSPLAGAFFSSPNTSVPGSGAFSIPSSATNSPSAFGQVGTVSSLTATTTSTANNRNRSKNSSGGLKAFPDASWKVGTGAGHNQSAPSVATSGGSLLKALRVLLISQQGELSSSVLLLRRVSYFLLILMLVAAFVGYQTTQQSFTFFKDNFQYLMNAGERRISIQAISYDIRSLLLISKGILPLSEEAHFRDDLLRNTKILEESHRYLYAHEDGVYGPLHELYSKKMVDMVDYLEGVKESSMFNLWDAGLLYLTKARSLYYSPLDTFTSENDLVKFSIINTKNRLLNAFNKSAHYYSSSTKLKADELVNVQLWVLLSVFGILLLLLLFTFVPKLKVIHQDINDVVKLFLTIPSSEVREIIETCRSQVESYLEFDVGGADLMVELTGKKVVERDIREFLDAQYSASSVNKSNQARFKSKEKEKKSKNGNRSQQINYAKRIWIFVAVLFVLLCCYFIGCFVWVLVHADTVTIRIDEIDLASYRRLVNRRLLFFTRESVVYPVLPYDSETSFLGIQKETEDLLIEYFDDENDLLFGHSAFRRLPGSSKRDPKQDRLMFEDGCARESLGSDVTVAPLAADCGTAYNNLLLSGLHSAITVLIRKSREFLKHFDKALIDANLIANSTTAAPTSWVQYSTPDSFVNPANSSFVRLVNNTLNGQEWEDLERLSLNYVRPGVQQSTGLYISEVNTFINNFLDDRFMVMLVMLFILPAFYFAFYIPFLTRLDQKLKHSRCLLLFLPQQIATQTDLFSKIIRAETRK